MSDQAGAAGQQCHGHIKCRTGFTKDPGGEEGATNRPDDRVDGVPGGIDPRDFIREKLEDIERAGDPENQRTAKDGERLVLRRKNDPLLLNRQAGDKNGEIKIHPRKAGQAESDSKQL